LQMVMLAYRLEGRQPPFAEWAAAQSGVRMANEFERADVLRAEEERLRAVYDGTEGVGLLRLNVRAALSEYDGSRGGYYLTAFTPGSVLTFTAYPVDRAHPERVSVRVDNPGELHFWPLDPATARGVLDRNGGLRNVVLDARMRITGISRRSDGTALSATLLDYTTTSDRHGQPVVLGELRVDGTGGCGAVVRHGAGAARPAAVRLRRRLHRHVRGPARDERAQLPCRRPGGDVHPGGGRRTRTDRPDRRR